MASNGQADFDRLYHRIRWAEAQLPEESLAALFDRLAETLLLDLQPESVLDVGCGRGYLVHALRQRGVAAWGIDSPDTSIQQVLPESQPFCKARSVLEPWPDEHYELIVCVDVLEHLASEYAEGVVEKMCSHADQVLFSCTPAQHGDVSHSNTLPMEQWAAIFDRCGFVHDLEFDAAYISPWAMRFARSDLPAEDRLVIYERRLWQLSQEVALRRDLAVEYKNELAKREMDLQYVNLLQLQAELDAIHASNSWKFMTRLQRMREGVIPLGSRREKLMQAVMHGLSVLKREGLVGFIVLSFQKLTTRLSIKTTRLRNVNKLRHLSVSNAGQVAQIEPVPVRTDLQVHTELIDIIICVHNAQDDVQRCLESLLEHTTQPYHMILVDDGSAEPTAAYLREFADQNQATLLRSENATGYTYAANRGMRSSSAASLVLLNSDTILTPGWLDRLSACLESDPRIGMVGPLSNTASWQSVPKIEENGDWASNPLPAGLDASDMAQLVAAGSARLYVDMPLLNGFCLMIRRKLLDEVGLFDEDSFGQGYGEEDDLVLRARKNGWKLALADDVYIYHAQSKSYSTEKRYALVERSQKILRQKHGDRIVAEGVRYCQYDPVLEGIRARVQVAPDRQQCINDGKRFMGKKILFVLHIIYSPGGGANVIRTESIAMAQMGVKIDYFHLEDHKESFIESYPDMALAAIFGCGEDLEFAGQKYDAVIATYNPTVQWLIPFQKKAVHPKLGYYIQGFEPLMYETGSARYKSALDSYAMIDDMVLITKTEWTNQQVKQAVGRASKIIGPSVDIDLYRPRPRITPIWPEGPLRISAMIRPESLYREPLKTMELLRQAAKKYKGEVEINLFGTPSDNSAFLELPNDFAWKMFGVLSPSQVANLLSQSDIFVDYSSHQAMGLTAMEAMACGCAVIVPQNGGVLSYAIHEKNSLIADSASFDSMWDALQRIVEDEQVRNQLRRNAIYDICQHYPERAALNLLNALFL